MTCQCNCNCSCPPPTPVLPDLPVTCWQVYRDFNYVVGHSSDPIPDTPRPDKATVFAEPTYKTCVKRVTDHAVEPPSGFARQSYSRRQAFNANNARILITSLDGFCHLYNTITFEHIATLPANIGSDSEMQWDADMPEILYHTDNFGGDKLYAYNIDTRIDTVVADFSGRWPFPGSYRAWTRGEGSPSMDSRYWCFQIETVDYEFLGILVYDKLTDTIVVSKTGAELGNTTRPDHCSMSLTGDFVVISWLNEVVQFDRLLEGRTVLADKSEHSDLALLPSGHDAYVSINYGSNNGDVYYIDMHSGERYVLFEMYINGKSSAVHFSGKAYDRPGFVVISCYADSTGNDTEWMHRKVFVASLEPQSLVINLAHHQSVFDGYWTEPHASTDRGLERVLFNSNWGVNSQTDMDTYMIQLEDAAPILDLKERIALVFNTQNPRLRGK